MMDRFKLKQDHRQSLPLWLQRFIGYRPSGEKAPFDPIPPLSFLRRIPMKYELWIFGWIGSFVGILLVEAIMATNTVFRDTYNAPIVIASFGASAVLVYGAIDLPLAQPRNFFGGHFISALIGVAITRLFALDSSYVDNLENRAFHPATFLNGGISMATAGLAMFMTGTVHPPAGGTVLIAAIDPSAVRLSWRFLPVILASTAIMFGWAMLINNIGRRKYPQYWWAPGKTFVIDQPVEKKDDEEAAVGTARDEGEDARKREISHPVRADLQDKAPTAS